MPVSLPIPAPTRSRAVAALLAALAFGSVPAGSFRGTSRAHAQAGATNADAQVFFERGNARFQRARRARGLRQQQLLEEALAAYVQSLRIVRSRNALFNAALVLEQLERPADAFAYYREYLAIPGLTDAERQDAERQLAALRPRVAVALVTSEPPGATVHVDRMDLAPVGMTPLEIALRPGAHRLLFSREGYAGGEATVRAARGERREVSVVLEATPIAVRIDAPEGGSVRVDGELAPRALMLPPGEHLAVWEGEDGARGEARFTLRAGEAAREVALVPAVGTLVVASEPAGEVSIGGAVVGAGRRLELRLPPGEHAVRIEAPGRTPLERRLRLDAGDTLMLAATLGEAPTPARFRPAAHTLLALGLAAAGGGAVLGTLSLNDRREWEARCIEPISNMADAAARCANDRDDYLRLSRAADGLFGLAGAALLTSVVLYAVGRSREGRPSSASLAVGLTRGGAMAAVAVPLGGTP